MKEEIRFCSRCQRPRTVQITGKRARCTSCGFVWTTGKPEEKC